MVVFMEHARWNDEGSEGRDQANVSQLEEKNFSLLKAVLSRRSQSGRSHTLRILNPGFKYKYTGTLQADTCAKAPFSFPTL